MVTLTLSVIYSYVHYLSKSYTSNILLNIFLVLFQSEQVTSLYSIWIKAYISIVRCLVIIWPHRTTIISRYQRTKITLIVLVLIAAIYKITTSLCRMSLPIISASFQFYIKSPYCLNINELEAYSDAILRFIIPVTIIVVTLTIIVISIRKIRKNFAYEDGVIRMKPLRKQNSDTTDANNKRFSPGGKRKSTFIEKRRRKISEPARKSWSSIQTQQARIRESPTTLRKFSRAKKFSLGSAMLGVSMKTRSSTVGTLWGIQERLKRNQFKPSSSLKYTVVIISKNISFLVFTSIYLTLDFLCLLQIVSSKDWNATFRLAYMLSSVDLAVGIFIYLASGRKFREESRNYFNFLIGCVLRRRRQRNSYFPRQSWRVCAETMEHRRSLFRYNLDLGLGSQYSTGGLEVRPRTETSESSPKSYRFITQLN